MTARQGWLGRNLLQGWRARALAGLLLLGSLAVMAQIVAGNWDVLAGYAWEIRPWWLAAAGLAFGVDLLLATLAWHLMVGRLAGFRHFRRSAKICWSANLAQRIPGPVYIAGRAVLYEREGVSKTTVSLLSGLEILFLIVSGTLTALLTLPFWTLPPALADRVALYWVLFAGAPAALALAHPRVLGGLWRRLAPGAGATTLRWRDTAGWLALYILVWIVGGGVLFCVLNFLQPVPATELVTVVGIWSLANSISLAGLLAISFIGLRELTLTLLLAVLIPAPVALIVAILIRLVWIAGEMASAAVAWRL